MHIRQGHYLGIAPVPGGLTNVCFVASRDAAVDWRSPARLLMSIVRTTPDFRPRFVHARLASPVAVLGPMAVDVVVPGTRGLLLAGDAAGFIDPMTGDGLRLALEGAELAARATLDVLEGRVPPVHAAAVLAVRRRRAFRAKWLFNRTVRLLVDRPALVAGAALAARALPSAFEQMIRYAGDC
jgi:flavin-dependent dehydrogenase